MLCSPDDVGERFAERRVRALASKTRAWSSGHVPYRGGAWRRTAPVESPASVALRPIGSLPRANEQQLVGNPTRCALDNPQR